jgi:hypothetical protein
VKRDWIWNAEEVGHKTGRTASTVGHMGFWNGQTTCIDVHITCFVLLTQYNVWSFATLVK